MIKTFKEIDKTKLSTTAFSEYINFKEENPDCIILFQIGDFFETICEDAVLFAEITGVTLGKRKIKDLGEVIQAGIPKASINNYIKKLLSNNIKICLCTQQKNENGEIYRKIERKYTQGTIIENEFLDSYENNFILTIIKNNNDFDIAYADVSTGQFYKTTANKSEIFLEIEKIEPNEILILQKEKEIFKELLQKYNSTILDENFERYSAKDIILEYRRGNEGLSFKKVPIERELAGSLVLKNYSGYRKKIMADYLFRRFLKHLFLLNIKAVFKILKNNGFYISYAMIMFILRGIQTHRFLE